MSVEYVLNQEYEEIRYSEASSKTAILLAIFLGGFGAHRFYTGYIGIGLIQLLTCGGFGLWVIIDEIQLLRNAYLDRCGRPLQGYSSSFVGGVVIFFIISMICSFYFTTAIIDKVRTAAINAEIANPLDVDKAMENKYVKEILNQNKTQQAPQVEKITYQIDTKSGLNIIDEEPCFGPKDLRMVCGTLVNTTKKPAVNVEIKLQLFDANKKFVSMSTAKAYRIEPGEQWKFQVPIYWDSVVSYKIFKITSY